MPPTSITLQRLAQQRLTQNRFATPAEVVAWLGAVQAQDFPGAKWSLGLRMQAASEDAIDQAFDTGAILRTHLMRPTWHFVLPDDIRWLLELTAPRVNAAAGSMYRRLELDEALFARSGEILTRVLQGGQMRTREELGQELAQAGIPAVGLRLIHLLFRAELDRILCSGPRRGKQFTYMLLEERAPQAKSLPRDAALAELTRRYFTGHGPATLRDFSWWSGLTLADGKLGLEIVGSQLIREEIDGQTYWFSPDQSPVDSSPTAFLLPTYDEIWVGYDGFDKSRRGEHPADAKDLFFGSTLVIDGRVAGQWRRTLKSKSVQVEISPFQALAPAEEAAVASAVQRYAGFLGLALDLPRNE